LVLSCDSVTNVSLRNFINFHLAHRSSCTALFTKHLPPPARLPGPKNKTKQGRDILCLHPETSQLLFLGSEADFDDDEISLPLNTLRSLHLKLLTSLIDTHIYILQKNLLEKQLTANKSHVSLKGELLPFMINSQFEDGGGGGGSSTVSPPGELLYAFLDTDKESIRVNTTTAFAIINKSADWVRKSFELDPPPSHRESSNKSTKERSTVKLQSSIVGDGCEFGDGVKILNCILMDNVVVGDGSILENCIVSSGGRIGRGVLLKECLVGPRFNVPTEGKFTNEFLTTVDETFFEP